MYTLSPEQLASVEGWVKILPDSMVKANYEKWLSELKPKERVTSEQLEKFVSYANALPHEFQNYPQEFAINVKNKTNPTVQPGVKKAEKVKKVEEKKPVMVASQKPKGK